MWSFPFDSRAHSNVCKLNYNLLRSKQTSKFILLNQSRKISARFLHFTQIENVNYEIERKYFFYFCWNSPEIFETVDAEANLSVERTELPESQPLVVFILVERIQMLWIFVYRALTARTTRRLRHAAIVYAHCILPFAFSKSAVLRRMTKK